MHNPFPPTSQALTEPNGLLAVGGDLEPATLVCAYAQGIFPWFERDEEILWWAPDPRQVIWTDRAHVSRSMRKILRQSPWAIRCNQAFDSVVEHCATAPRGDSESGTWITTTMREAYTALHSMGVAHSIEIMAGDRLVGGLYGVMLDQMFFGESMFSLEPNASKAAFIALCHACQARGIELIDCQVHNPHLMSLGAELMSRQDFENHLRGAIKTDMQSIITNPLCLAPRQSESLDEPWGNALVSRLADLL